MKLYRIPWWSYQRGVTFIEILLVVTIIAIVGTTVAPLGAGFLIRSQLKNKTNEVVASLRTAQLNSISGKEASQWGVVITANDIVMFKGSSYALPGTPFDQRFTIPSSISITPVQIVFDRLAGNPDAVATIVLSANTGETSSVSVNEVGAVDVF